LLVIATLTSTISLLEVIVAALTEEFNISRPKAAWIGAACTAVIGIVATMSFQQSSPLHIGGLKAFDILDLVTSHYIMPLGGLLIVLFVGWRMKRADTLNELTNEGTLRSGIRKAILFIIRYLAPVVIAVIFISQLIGK
jgi:NSS family neurotransmitter:Na+ symporter